MSELIIKKNTLKCFFKLIYSVMLVSGVQKSNSVTHTHKHAHNFLLQLLFPYAAAAAKSLQSCPTLCDPIDGSPSGSPVPGILQARTL